MHQQCVGWLARAGQQQSSSRESCRRVFQVPVIALFHFSLPFLAVRKVFPLLSRRRRTASARRDEGNEAQMVKKISSNKIEE
jgi:hypothetical protein